MKKRILIVEDEIIIARDIESKLRVLGYETLPIVSSGEEAVERAGELKPDLILMDIVLNGEIDGIETTSRIGKLYDIPVVYLTAYADDKTLERAKVTDPFGYMIKPFGEKELHSTVEMAIYKHRSMERLLDSMEGTINALATALEMRDPYTAGHQRRVGELAEAIALELDYPSDEVRGIHLAALIHDIGKIYVPSEILSKPTELTNNEFNIIKTHARIGYDILGKIEFSWPIAEMVYQHHERLDGSGYPRGLKGDEIIFQAKILAVADVVEAMTSRRPYRAALGIDTALKEISAGRGTKYDPDAVDACVKLFRKKGFTFSDVL
ncbi:MAG: HD domain-containing protein [Syntrophales bacterium]|nr:HD domain-containing protein [Syntrophales bacterium]